MKNPFDKYTPKQLALIGVGMFVVSAVLGALFNSDVNAAIKRAYKELDEWEGKTETDSEMSEFLRKYWNAAGLSLQPASIAWSAAFISYAVGSKLLKPSQSHIEYTRAAYKARLNKERGKYWAYQPSELGKVKKGDILVRSRGDSPTHWSDVVGNTGFHQTHGDLVTKVSGNQAFAIGGNKQNSVNEEIYPLVDGRPPSNVFAVLRKS